MKIAVREVCNGRGHREDGDGAEDIDNALGTLTLLFLFLSHMIMKIYAVIARYSALCY
jgi:hypothetical protein